MCLDKANIVVKTTEETVLASAKEHSNLDLIVYKRFESKIVNGKREYKTPHKAFMWPGENLVKVDSFSTSWRSHFPTRISINRGLHAYVSKERAIATKSRGQVVRKMIIPAYTTFIKGERDEIVSLAMRMAPGQDRLPRPKKEIKKKLKINKKKNVRSKRTSTKFGQTKVVGKR